MYIMKVVLLLVRSRFVCYDVMKCSKFCGVICFLIPKCNGNVTNQRTTILVAMQCDDTHTHISCYAV